MNRVSDIRKNLIGTEDADDLMQKLIEVLTESGKVPTDGKIYIFLYKPKTPNIRYDQHPLVAVTDLFAWGFRGTNFHHRETRQYTWNEIAGQVYIVKREELDDLLSVRYAKFLTK